MKLITPLLLLTTSAVADSTCRIPLCTIERSIDRPGGDFKKLQTDSFYDYVTHCEDDLKCTNVCAILSLGPILGLRMDNCREPKKYRKRAWYGTDGEVGQLPYFYGMVLFQECT